MIYSIFEKLEAAFIKAGMDLAGHTGASFFKIPVKGTSPRLFVSLSEDFELGKALSSDVVKPIIGWIKCSDQLPELRDGSVLAFFAANGGINMVHIEDYFGDIKVGVDDNGTQLYTKWYLNAGITHWMPLSPPDDV